MTSQGMLPEQSDDMKALLFASYLSAATAFPTFRGLTTTEVRTLPGQDI